jgi:hypothetical protein
LNLPGVLYIVMAIERILLAVSSEEDERIEKIGGFAADVAGPTGAEVTLAGYLLRLLGQLLAFGAIGLVVYAGVEVLVGIRSAGDPDRGRADER